VSDRAARVTRRAGERARHRAVLDAADPTVGGRAAHHVCVLEGCDAHGPSIELGPLVITLCRQHKAELDRRWSAASVTGSMQP